MQPAGAVRIGPSGTSVPAAEYRCGECGSPVLLKPEDAPRCFECGHRVLYKVRPKGKLFQYEAR